MAECFSHFVSTVINTITPSSLIFYTTTLFSEMNNNHLRIPFHLSKYIAKLSYFKKAAQYNLQCKLRSSKTDL